MAQDISELVVKVTSDGISDAAKNLNDLTKAADGAEQATKKLGTAVTLGASANDANTGTSKAMEESVKKATDAINMLTGAINTSTDAARNAAAGQRTLGQASEEAGNAGRRAAAGHGSNAGAIREVLVLLHEASQGQFKRFGGSLLVLANQWQVIPGIIAAVGAATFATVTVIVGALALMTWGIISGAKEMENFRKSMILTGNMAGLTRDSLHDMSAELADGVTGGAHHAQLMLEELAATGKFSGETLESVGRAALAFEHLTGESGDKIIKVFDGMEKGVAKWAAKNNESYHFLTYAQYEEIKVLELQGEKQAAMQLATEAMSKSLDDHGRKVGAIVQWYREWGIAVDRIKGWFASIGAGATEYEKFQEAGKKVIDIQAKIQAITSKPAAKQTMTEKLSLPGLTDDLNKANDERLKAQGVWAAKSLKAQQSAESAQVQAEAIEADKLAEVEQRRNRTRHEKLLDDMATEKNTRAAQNAGILQAELAAQGVSYVALVSDAKKRDEEQDKVLRQNGQVRINDKTNEFNAQLQIAQQYGVKLKTNEDQLQTALSAVQERWKEKKVAGSDDSAARRDGALAEVRAELQDQMAAHREFQRASKELATKQGEDEHMQLVKREEDRQLELKQIQDAYNKEMAIIQKHSNGKSALWLAQNDNRAIKAGKDMTNATNLVTNDGKDDARAVLSRELAEREKITKEITNQGDAENKRIDGLIKAEKDRANAIGISKSAQMDFRATEEIEETYKLQAQQDSLNMAIVQASIEGDTSSAYVDGMKLQISYLDQQMAKRRQLGVVYAQAAGEQRKIEAQDHTTKNLDDALAAAKRFEKGMTDAFGKVGKAIGGLATAYAQMNKDVNTAQEHYTANIKNGMSEADAQAQQNAESTQAQIAGFGGMAEAAQGMFSENSKGYQAMGAVSKVFHMAEAAMQAARIVQLGIAAVLTQGEGDPYTAFARMAAMTALVVGLGVAISGGGGSGGGKSAATVQASQGTGTVFGDTGTKQADGTTLYTQKSDSIAKSLSLLKDNSNIMLPINEAMLASLKAIQSSMSGLANLVVRATGVTDGTNLGVTEGKTSLGGISGAVTKVLSAVPLVGGLLGKLSSLWGSTTTEIKDSGLQFGGSVASLQAGQGYNQYASVDTTKSSWFGLSKSTSNSVKTQGLSAELSDQFGLVFTNLESTLKVAATALGKNAGDVGSAIENMVLATSTVSLKGLTGTDLTNAINNVISAAMDQIAEHALPGMDDFRQVGEGYSETVIRVATGVQTATGALEQLGIKAIEYTSIINKQGDVGVEITRQSLMAAESAGGALSGIGTMISTLDGTVDELISTYKALDTIRKQMNATGLNGNGLNVNVVKGAGGVSQLNSSLSTYQDKFFTDAEKSAIMVKSLTAEFNKLGVALPTSKAALRDLITATGVSTDATATLTGQLLALTGEYSDAVDAQATANSTATDALNTSIDALSKFKDTIKSFKESLLTGDLSNLTPTQKYLEAKQEYESTVAKAMAGDATAQANVTQYAQSYLEASRVVNASDPAYTASLEQVQADMDKLESYTGTQLTDAQAQLAVLNAQADSLTQLNATADSINANLANIITMPSPVMVAADTSTADQIAELRKEAADQAAAASQKIDDLTAALYDATGKAAVATSEGLTAGYQTAVYTAKTQSTTFER